jgi:RNA polymerase sigma-70 factor (ECF subfamily)
VELEDVFRAYERPVFAYFLRIVGNRHDAEELAQETFVRACGAFVRYRGDALISTWLFGIAHHVLLEASRQGLFQVQPQLPEAVAGDEPDHETRLDIERAFAQLEPIDKETLMLVDFLGFTPADAARLVGADGSAFRMRLHRARRRLRDKLEVTQ